MKYKLILIFLYFTSCTQNYNSLDKNTPFNSKGFAYIYDYEDFKNKIIKHKLDENSLQIVHDRLKPGSLIRITNIKTNKSLIIKSTKRFKYPGFYKILITKPVAEKLKLEVDLPLVEIIEIKENKSFIAKKTKIFKEEKKIQSKTPVESVTINNISKNNKKKSKNVKDKFYIVIAEFYSKDSAIFLKKRITQEMTNFNHKKLLIKSKKSNKISLLSGPYKSINFMKNDYIQFNNFGFEELDITINE